MAELDSEQIAQIRIETGVDPGGDPVLTLAGELDSSNAAKLEAKVAALAAERPERLIFDMSELRFMDSAGIAVLLGAASKVEVVQLRNPSRIVRRVVEVTGLTRVLPMEP